jgi:hypothetical protein
MVMLQSHSGRLHDCMTDGKGEIKRQRINKPSLACSLARSLFGNLDLLD